MLAPLRRPVPAGAMSASGSLWLTGGHVVDVVSGRVRRATNLAIAGGRIIRLTTEPPPPGDTSIDVGGRYLLPGLISVHTHLSVTYPFSDTDEQESEAVSVLRALARARDALLAGVTTIRCVHEQNQADILLRRATHEGWVDAPRILGAGRAISTTGGHGHGMGAVYADGYDAFLRAARQELAAGADHIKVFITGGIAREGERMLGAEMTMDEMRAVVRAATERGRYVVAHASHGPAIAEAIEAGVTCFEHAYEVDDDVFAEMARRRLFLTPTLCVDRCPDWMADHHFTDWQIARAMEVGPPIQPSCGELLGYRRYRYKGEYTPRLSRLRFAPILGRADRIFDSYCKAGLGNEKRLSWTSASRTKYRRADGYCHNCTLPSGVLRFHHFSRAAGGEPLLTFWRIQLNSLRL
jgi:imidazolonepropionase-like amidohydrolase